MTFTLHIELRTEFSAFSSVCMANPFKHALEADKPNQSLYLKSICGVNLPGQNSLPSFFSQNKHLSKGFSNSLLLHLPLFPDNRIPQSYHPHFSGCLISIQVVKQRHLVSSMFQNDFRKQLKISGLCSWKQFTTVMSAGMQWHATQDILLQPLLK